MRAFFLLMILAGVGLAGLYPWYNNNFSGAEIGRWTAFETGSAFREIDVPLKASQAPVRVLVDLTTRNEPNFQRDVAVLTLVANLGSHTVLADTMGFGQARKADRSPQMGTRVYRGEAGVISPVEDATYRFVIGQGDAEGVDFSKVELVLRSGTGLTDPRAQPAGFALVGVGFIGLILASRFRNRRPENPNSKPPPPRWGRNAGQDR